jgi:hypothetical protein
MYYLKARFPKGTLTSKKKKEIIKFFSDKDNEEKWAYDCNGSSLGERLFWNPDGFAYEASISHMKDLTGVAESIAKKFGASKVVWANEEGGCSNLDSLFFENNERIVQDILERKTLLPSLLGINDELDALIADKLKE